MVNSSIRSLVKEKMQCRFNVGFGFSRYCKARTNQRQSSLKQVRSHIVYWMWLVLVSNIINHIIQFEATFCMTSKENSHCGLNVAAVTIVTSSYNPHRSHIWKTWNQKPHCGLNVAFIIHIIQIICSSGFNPDYVDYSSHK